MNTYLYIMELIFIEILGKLVCDYDSIPHHIKERRFVTDICFNLTQVGDSHPLEWWNAGIME